MLLFLTLFSCTSETTQSNKPEPSFIEVQLNGETGSMDSPLPFSSAPVSFSLSISTLDRNASPYPMNGNLKLNIRPGKLSAGIDPWIKVTDGTWSGEITFQSAFGPSRIWVTDEGDKDVTSERQATFATGISEAIYYNIPTIAEFNNIEDTETNHLEGEFTEVRVEDRDVVVTVVSTNGFWISDLDDAPGNYSGMYIYTFGKPEDVYPGARLTKLTGGNQEYLGATQLSFPDYEIEQGRTLDIPDPAVLDDTSLCEPSTMESFESSMIAIKNATIPSSFSIGSSDYDGYIEYGQWPLNVGGCTIYVDSTALSYAFDPVENAGETIAEIQGLVSQIWTKWVIILRNDDGLSIDGNRYPRRPNATLPRRPLPRSRN